jgi:cytochrome b pre-mRNA-processing protein 3
MPPLATPSGEIEAYPSPMLFERLFRPRPSQAAGRALYAQVVEQSRTPKLYAELGAPDTVEGRFELYSLHVILLLERLRGQGPEARAVSQALFDAYLKGLDDALREMGVGDLSVGKKMRKLGEAIYGRVKSYDAAVGALPAKAPLRDFIARTVFETGDASRAADMALYAIGQRAALADWPLERLLEGQAGWAAP